MMARKRGASQFIVYIITFPLLILFIFSMVQTVARIIYSSRTTDFLEKNTRILVTELPTKGSLFRDIEKYFFLGEEKTEEVDRGIKVPPTKIHSVIFQIYGTILNDSDAELVYYEFFYDEEGNFSVKNKDGHTISESTVVVNNIVDNWERVNSLSITVVADVLPTDMQWISYISSFQDESTGFNPFARRVRMSVIDKIEMDFD